MSADKILTDAVAALCRPGGSIRLPLVFGRKGETRAVQIYSKTRKVGPLIFPPEGATIAETLRIIGALVEDHDKWTGVN